MNKKKIASGQGLIGKINRILHSTLAMSCTSIQNQLAVYDKVIGQLFQDDLIEHITSPYILKLFCYEIILLSTRESERKCESMRNACAEEFSEPGFLGYALASLNETLRDLSRNKTDFERQLYSD